MRWLSCYTINPWWFGRLIQLENCSTTYILSESDSLSIRPAQVGDRLLFPLACTFCRCLGLTLDRATFDFRSECFCAWSTLHHSPTHSDLVRCINGLAMFANRDDQSIVNAVYNQLISLNDTCGLYVLLTARRG